MEVLKINIDSADVRTFYFCFYVSSKAHGNINKSQDRILGVSVETYLSLERVFMSFLSPRF